MHVVFVYGSLKRGQPANRLLSRSTFLFEGWVSGYRLIDLGDFPGMVRGDEGDLVSGEVYEVDDEAMRVLNTYEGDCYRLEHVSINDSHGRRMYGCSYVFLDPEQFKHSPIADGVWRGVGLSRSTS